MDVLFPVGCHRGVTRAAGSVPTSVDADVSNQVHIAGAGAGRPAAAVTLLLQQAGSTDVVTHALLVGRRCKCAGVWPRVQD